MQIATHHILFEGKRIPLPPEKQAVLEQRKAQAQDITLGVRPEHISICEPEQAYIQATVDVAEMMGSSVHLHMTVQGREVVVVLPVLGNNLYTVNSTETLPISLQKEAILIFESGGYNIIY